MGYRFDIMCGTDIHSSTCVVAEDKEIIQMFLCQHGFHENAVYQIMYDDNNCEIKQSLKLYKFGSNNSKEVYNVFTTTEILENVLDFVVPDIEESLVFNHDLIFEYESHDIIRVINESIYNLRFANIRNYILDDEEMDERDIEYEAKFIKVFTSMNEFDYSCKPDLNYNRTDDFNSYLDEALKHDINKIKDDDLMPITIESYISGFIHAYS